MGDDNVAAHVVAALVQKGANVNLRAKPTDMSPLMYAALLGAPKTIEVTCTCCNCGM